MLACSCVVTGMQEDIFVGKSSGLSLTNAGALTKPLVAFCTYCFLSKRHRGLRIVHFILAVLPLGYLMEFV